MTDAAIQKNYEQGDVLYWTHTRMYEGHIPRPDREKTYIQPGTGRTEAPCKVCGEAVVCVRR